MKALTMMSESPQSKELEDRDVAGPMSCEQNGRRDSEYKIFL